MVTHNKQTVSSRLLVTINELEKLFSNLYHENVTPEDVEKEYFTLMDTVSRYNKSYGAALKVEYTDNWL